MPSNSQSILRTRVGLLTAVLVAALTVGCSLPKFKSETKEGPVLGATEQGERKLMSIQQSDAQRDIVTGERRFVFCEGKDCTTATQKSVAPQMRKVVVPSRAPGMADSDKARTFKLGFDYDRSTLNAEGIKVLEEAAAYAAERKASEIRIHGKADSYDRDAYNLKLAERRARTAERFLKGKKLDAKLVVDASIVRVTADGMYPPGETFKGRRVDLDIVIEIVPTTK